MRERVGERVPLPGGKGIDKSDNPPLGRGVFVSGFLMYLLAEILRWQRLVDEEEALCLR